MLWNSTILWLKEERTLRRLREKRGNALLGFFIQRTNSRAAIAIDHKRYFVPIKYLGKRRPQDRVGLHRSLRRIKEAAGDESYQTAVWGLRDKLMLGVDLSDHFNDLIRVEAGLLTDTSSRKSIKSVIVNYRGIYYDGCRESDLEQGLNKLSADYATKDEMTAAVVSKALARGVTKYNLPLSSHVKLPKEALLVIGQVTGDQAIEATDTVCRCNKSLIEYLCKVAPVNNVSSIYYKPHPMNPGNAREIESILETNPAVKIVPAKTNILPLLEQRPKVATLTSAAGLEAAVRGCEVHCFGVSFYSNWGFTKDYVKCVRRRNQLTAEDVFAYVLIKQTRYVDVESRHPVSVMEAFELPPSSFR